MVEITTQKHIRTLRKKLGLQAQFLKHAQNSIFPVISVESRIPQIRVILLGDPAADTEYSVQTVPTNKIWFVRGVRGKLTTDATAANRKFNIVFRDTNDNVLTGIGTEANHVASTTVTYVFGVGCGVSDAFNANDIYSNPLPEIFLPQGFDIQFTTSNRQATDNWDAGILTVEEYDMSEEGYERFA